MKPVRPESCASETAVFLLMPDPSYAIGNQWSLGKLAQHVALVAHWIAIAESTMISLQNASTHQTTSPPQSAETRTLPSRQPVEPAMPPPKREDVQVGEEKWKAVRGVRVQHERASFEVLLYWQFLVRGSPA